MTPELLANEQELTYILLDKILSFLIAVNRGSVSYNIMLQREINSPLSWDMGDWLWVEWEPASGMFPGVWGVICVPVCGKNMYMCAQTHSLSLYNLGLSGISTLYDISVYFL